MIFTLPNQITLLRMGLTPLFLIFFVSEKHGTALVVFILAGITDALDGIIARLWKQKTELGAYLDPVADKMLLVTAILGLTLLDVPNAIPAWIAVFFIARDTIMMVSVAVIILATKCREFKPAVLGKLTTLSQIVLVIDALFYNWLGVPSNHFQFLLWLSFILTALSAVQYSVRASKLLAAEASKNQSV